MPLAIVAGSLLLTLAPQDPVPIRTIAGRVVDMRGVGVPAAAVWVVDPDDGDRELARSATDAEGYFRVAGVTFTDTSVEVRATRPGLCVGQAWARGVEPFGVLVLHDATTVRGVVTDRNGDPVAGAPVSVAPDWRALAAPTLLATTDATGAFEVENAPLGPTRVSAWVPGEGLASIHVRVRGDDAFELRPSGEPTTSLQVRFTGLPAEAPPRVTLVLGAYLYGGFTHLPAPYHDPQVAPPAWSAKNLPDCRYSLRAQTPGFVFEPKELDLLAGAGPHEVEFRAVPSGAKTLSWPGVVRGPDGEPVTGASFALRQTVGLALTSVRATSDSEGRLVFDSHLAEGTRAVIYSTDDDWVVDQRKREGMHGVRDRRFLDDHETLVSPDVPFVLDVVPACRVHGRIVHADGRPARYAELELETFHPSGRWQRFATSRTDRNGWFAFARLHHAPADTRVSIEGPAGSGKCDPFRIEAAGSNADTGKITLAPAAVIEGVVVHADGRPAAGVVIRRRAWDMQAGHPSGGRSDDVVTDRLGRFRFTGVPLGGAFLHAIVDPAAGQEIPKVDPFAVHAGETYEFRIELDR